MNEDKWNTHVVTAEICCVHQLGELNSSLLRPISVVFRHRRSLVHVEDAVASRLSISIPVCSSNHQVGANGANIAHIEVEGLVVALSAASLPC